jgi:hypothetical protein
MTTRKEQIEKFFKRVKKTKSCWLWIGNKKTGGYGQFYASGKTVAAHRWAFENIKGEKIKTGNYVCHKCDVRNCVKPSHLWQGTHLENIYDSIKKGRFITPERLIKIKENFKKYRGQPMGEKHGHAKLKEFQVIEILKSKRPLKELSDRYGVTKQMIKLIKDGRYWNTPACKAARQLSQIKELEK